MLSLRFILLGLLLIFNFPSFAAPEKIRLQLKWLNSFQFAGYYTAKAKGFYATENLDVELRERKMGINNIEQVINGESEYGVADTALLIERLNGVPVVVLASIFQHSPLVYITLKSSGIESPYEMRGKRIMDDTHDNAPLRTMLYEAGLKNEFTHLPNSGKIDDLIQGKTDVFVAYSTDEPEFYAKRGIDINIIDPRNYGVDFLGDNLFTTQQEINKHPERVQKFLRASLKGWQYAVNHSDEIIDLILSQYNTQPLSREHLNFEARETLKMIAPQSVSIGHSDIKRFERIAQTYLELGLVKSTENLNGFIYNQQQITPTISLTDNEKDWLAMHRVIRVGTNPDFAPYEFFNEKGEYVGLSVDYLHKIGQLLGVKFDIIKTKSWAETVELAKRGEVDMLTDVDKVTTGNQDYLNFTDVFMNTPFIIVNNEDGGFIGSLNRLEGKKIAIKEGIFIRELLIRDYPSFEILTAKTSQAGLNLVSSGKADAYLGDAAAAHYEIIKGGQLNLKFSGQTEYYRNHRMAAISKFPELASILTKALNAIPENEKNQIQNRWLNVKAEKEINFEELAKYAIPLILLIFYGIYRNFQLRREISQRKKLEVALKNSIYLFKSVINNAPVIRVFWKDVDGNYLGANNNFAKDAGLNYAEELIGKNDFDMAWKEEGELYRADDRHVMETNTPKLNFEEPQTTPDGKEIILRTSKVPLHDENGKVIGIIGIYEDITQSKMHEQQLEHIAYHDVLTGLPNRSLLADRMQLALAHARRNNSFIAICYLDLDGFKTVNDSLGHKAGDVLLVEAANRMKKALREYDTVARLGGDEFVLLLRLNTMEECESTLFRLLEMIKRPFYIENHIASVSASIGVTVYPNDNADADTLLRHADQAMYEAKQNQKNCFKIYNTEIAHEFEAQQNALKEIEKAILENEFVLFFQPKVDMQKGKIIGAEALIRWNHPERGLLMPNDFLELIDNHPLAIQLDAWVMNNALKQMTKWHECGLMWTISVNLSAGSLQTHNFSEQLAALLADYPNVKPEHFELEILETEALQDLAQTSEMIIACQALGVKFSLDDFGTGYSSLAYLKHLPANILKIDQSFVRDMLDDADDLAIVKGVIGLAASFKRYVIAEGVETIEHGVMIAHLKCDYAQGYAIAKPMPAVTFEIWAETWKLPKEWIKPR
jgi:diguanylate cyclase (GGDEF)-like protein/PAS domain S-box-containing protein